MTDAECHQITQLISIGWPKTPLSEESAILYGDRLSGFSFQETYDAIEELLDKSAFLPSIAEIRRVILRNHPTLPEPAVAWALVCQRYGPSRGSGDSSITLGPTIQAALDVEGIDPWRFHTTENRHWLKQGFIDIYTMMRKNALQLERKGSRILDTQTSQNGHLKLSLGWGVDATLPARPTIDAIELKGGDEPERL